MRISVAAAPIESHLILQGHNAFRQSTEMMKHELDSTQ